MTGGKNVIIKKEKYLSKEEPQHHLSTLAQYLEDLPTKTSAMTETASFIIPTEAYVMFGLSGIHTNAFAFNWCEFNCIKPVKQ